MDDIFVEAYGFAAAIMMLFAEVMKETIGYGGTLCPANAVRLPLN